MPLPLSILDLAPVGANESATSAIAASVALAQAAEEHGWDGFFTWDGISVGELDTWDPWALLGALAVSTGRIRLGAMVFPLARRRPWKVAREALTVDHLSNGRLVIPVALGAIDDRGFSGVHPEVTDRKQRAERLDETLKILKLAWQGETFSFEGTHYRVEDNVFQPRPVNGDIPIWVVGAWPSAKSVGRAAKYEGMLPATIGDTPEGSTGLTPDVLREIVAWVREHRESDRPFEFVIEGVTPIGDSDAASAQVKTWADAGATWWIESMWGDFTLDDLKRRIAQGPPAV